MACCHLQFVVFLYKQDQVSVQLQMLDESTLLYNFKQSSFAILIHFQYYYTIYIITNTYNIYLTIRFKHRMMYMENRVLRYFLTVISEGNISAAAKLLHVTQPTLLRQLKDLENELNVDLFYRRGRYIELTQEGRYLANHAKNIIKSS